MAPDGQQSPEQEEGKPDKLGVTSPPDYGQTVSIGHVIEMLMQMQGTLGGLKSDIKHMNESLKDKPSKSDLGAIKDNLAEKSTKSDTRAAVWNAAVVSIGILVAIIGAATAAAITLLSN